MPQDLNKQLVDTISVQPNLLSTNLGVPTQQLVQDQGSQTLLRNLGKFATDIAGVALENQVKANQIQGAMLSASGQDLPEDVPYSTKVGYQLNEARLSNDKFFSEEKSFIAQDGKSMTPEQYSARARQIYTSSVEGLDPQRRRLADSLFTKTFTELARVQRDQFLANNRVRQNDTASELLRSLADKVNTNTGKVQEDAQKELDSFVKNKLGGLTEDDFLNVLHSTNLSQLLDDNNVLNETISQLGIRSTAVQADERSRALRSYERLQEKKVDEAFTHDQLRMSALVQGGTSDKVLDESIKLFEEKYKDTKPSFDFSNASLRWHQAATQARGSLDKSRIGNELYRQGALKGDRAFNPTDKDLQQVAKTEFDTIDQRAQELAIKASGGDQQEFQRILPSYIKAAKDEQRNLWNNNAYVHNFLKDKWNTELNSIVFSDLKEGQSFNPQLRQAFLEMQEYEKLSPVLFTKHLTDEDARLRYDRIKRQMSSGQSFEESALFAKKIEDNPKITDKFSGIDYNEARADVIENIRDNFDTNFVFGRSFKDNIDLDASIEGRLQYEIVTKPHLSVEDVVANVTHLLSKEFEIMNGELKPNFGIPIVDRMQKSYIEQFPDGEDLRFKRDILTNSKIDPTTTQDMYDWVKGQLVESGFWKNFGEGEEYFVQFNKNDDSITFSRRSQQEGSIGVSILDRSFNIGKLMNEYNKNVLIPNADKRAIEVREGSKNKETLERISRIKI